MGKSVFPTKVLAGLSITSTGPASADLVQNVDLDKGLTKRELFAAMAMQGALANNVDWAPKTESVFLGLSAVCVRFADALLRELDKSEDSKDF